MADLKAINEAAKKLSLSSWTVRAHVRNGNIRAVRCGKRILIHEDELERICRQGLPSLKHKNPATEQATNLK
jgi:excisionase family DNA binding protein